MTTKVITHCDELSELQELKMQCALIEQKLSKQEIINEQLLKSVTSRSISRVKRLYLSNFSQYFIIIPILNILFFVHHEPVGFILFMNLATLLGLYIDIKGYQILNPNTLFNLSMSEASERIIRHKRWRKRGCYMMLVPISALAVCMILRVGHNSMWNHSLLVLTIFFIILTILIGTKLEKRCLRKLDEALEQLKAMRGVEEL